MSKKKKKTAKKNSKMAYMEKKAAIANIVASRRSAPKMVDRISIAFITDDNYVIPTATAITSLILSKNEDTYVDIYVISTCLSQDNILKFKEFESNTVKIFIVQRDLSKYKDLHKYREAEKNVCVATPSALLKFELPFILDSYDKTLYMDGDILVQRDLTPLWHEDIQDFYVAAAYDTGCLYSNNPKFYKYPQYFNSGVMLLNLKLMRENNISEKLYEAKKNSKDMSLMDQNVLNEVLKEKIKIVDIRYNYLVTNLTRAAHRYSFDGLNQLFQSNYKSLHEIEKKAYVLHFSSKDKPWKYYNGMYSEKWYDVFQKSPYAKYLLQRECWQETEFLIPHKRSSDKLIISLTSYPARIHLVHRTINTLLHEQLLPADKVILWLAPEQFPNREKDLPQELLDLTKEGLSIDWYHDIRSYKKLIPTLKKYPKAIIVTADDDILYPPDWLAKLYMAYCKNPNYIWCHRAHFITFDTVGDIRPYKNWRHCISNQLASFQIFGTSGAGVLYPPSCFTQDIFDETSFKSLAPDADDIWFWAMCVLNKKKMAVVPQHMSKLVLIKDAEDDEALWKTNVLENKNDKQLRLVLDHFPEVEELLKGYKKGLFLSYLALPYLLLRKRQQYNKLLTLFTEILTTYRVDITNLGHDNGMTICSDKNSKLIPTQKNVAIISSAQKNVYTITGIKKGELYFKFRGQDKKYDNVRIPIWIDYQSIKINGVEIIDHVTSAWHDQFFTHKIPVEENQVVKLEIKQICHKYSQKELSDVIYMINANPYCSETNISRILSYLSERRKIWHLSLYKKKKYFT